MPRRTTIESQLVELKTLLHKMADRVLAGLSVLVHAFEAQTPMRTEHLVKLATADAEVDILERTIDKAILDLFATQQPLAFELRFAYASAKIANYLERMGDAVESLSRQLLNHPALLEREKLASMIRATLELYTRAYAAMFADDMAQISEIDLLDDKVDAQYRQIYLKAKDILLSCEGKREGVETALQLINVSTQIEKFADLACHWAKQVDFARNGTARASISRTKYKIMFIDAFDGLLASIAASMLAESVKDLVNISVLAKSDVKQTASVVELSDKLSAFKVTPALFPMTTLQKAQWQRTLLFIEIGEPHLSATERDLIPFKTVQLKWNEFEENPSHDEILVKHIQMLRARTDQLAQLIVRAEPIS